MDGIYSLARAGPEAIFGVRDPSGRTSPRVLDRLEMAAETNDRTKKKRRRNCGYTNNEEKRGGGESSNGGSTGSHGPCKIGRQLAGSGVRGVSLRATVCCASPTIFYPPSLGTRIDDAAACVRDGDCQSGPLSTGAPFIGEGKAKG
jgi:hypothetical protein